MKLYLAIIGGLFVLETVSVIIQVISFKLTGKRIFKMAPIHHHFEKKGWAESTISNSFLDYSYNFSFSRISYFKTKILDDPYKKFKKIYLF